MTYRTLLVHVDTSAEGRSRLENTAHLARKLDARLVGVGAIGLEPYPDRTSMSERHAREWIAEDLRACEQLFREVTGGLTTDWRTRVRRPAMALSDLACGADLVIGSRTAESEVSLVFARPDDLVLTAGTPVLLQPPAAAPLEAARIVFGWKNTRESRRAATDALPLLTTAREVLLLRFVAETVSDDDDDGLSDVAERLRGHGVDLTVERRPRRAASVGEDLIDAATAAGADLIVAGAYGQPRVRELILGGVTRSLLAHAPQYVLFSH
jgi:nucleotide-binding universal stress UspA family protein